MSGVFFQAESTMTLKAAICTPSGPSGPHGLNARSIRVGNSLSHQPAKQRFFCKTAHRGEVKSSSSKSDQKREGKGISAGYTKGGISEMRCGAAVVSRGRVAAKGGLTARAGAIKGERAVRVKRAGQRGSGAGPSDNMSQKSGLKGRDGMSASATSSTCASPPPASSTGAGCLTLVMPGRPCPRQPPGGLLGWDGSGGFLGPREKGRLNGRVALGGLGMGPARSTVKVRNMSLQYAAQSPPSAVQTQPLCIPSQHPAGLGTGLAPYQIPDEPLGAYPMAFLPPELGLGDARVLQHGSLRQEPEGGSYVRYPPGNEGVNSNYFSAAGKSGRRAEALEMLQSMKAEGCRPNLITYNAMIDACSKGGLPERAHALFHELQEAGLQPDKITYNSLMGAYGRVGQWRKAEAVFEEMGRGRLARDLHSYNTLLDAFCKGGQVSLAERLLESMSAAGIEPNVMTYSSMIDGYAKSGREMDAVAMYARLQEMMKRNPGIPQDSVLYNTSLDVDMDMPGRAGKTKEAPAVRSQKEAAGLGTDLVGLNATRGSRGKNVKVHLKGGASARQRRLKARKERLSTVEKPADPALLAVTPEVRLDHKLRKRRADNVHDYVTAYLMEIGKVKLLTREEEILLSMRLRSSMKLTAAKERLKTELGRDPNNAELARHLSMPVSELLQNFREGAMARNKLVLANLRLVVSVAKKYTKNGIELADLIQAGTTGLQRGVEKFDPSRGYKMSTYVHWWIRQAINRAIADHSRTIRLPVHVHESLMRIKCAKARLMLEGVEPTVQNLAEHLGLPEKKVRNVLKVQVHMKSLEENIRPRNSFEEGSSLHNFVEDSSFAACPSKVADVEQLKLEVRRLLLESLDPRERDIIRAHFGIGRNNGEPMTLENISHRHGISRERARQLETVAMRRLKAASLERELDRYLV